MSKIICDICGTKYPDTAEKCPICGCSRDAAADFLGDDFLAEEISDESTGKNGRFSNKKKKEIFDFDEVNTEALEAEEVEEETPYDEEEEYEESRGHNTFVVILLTILIVALLAAAGFLFIKYFLPNMNQPEETAPVVTTEVVPTTTEAPTTELVIPCEMLILTSGTAELNEIGQNFLLHVQATPEDTTDTITYTSENEAVAIVSEDGKVTAVGEGETVILISCGSIQTTCPVIVQFVEETLPAEEETTGETTDETTDETGEGENTNAAVKNGITLKLKQTDIRLGVYYQYQLKLDCDLNQDEVEWRSEHPHIATVDEQGVITAVKDGTTSIIVKYGDQEVSCIVRCTY